MKLLGIVGRFALFLASMAFLTAVSFFVIGAYVASWPITRISPRNRRMQSVVGLAVAGVTVARAWGLEDRFMEAATEATEATEGGD